MTFKQFRVIAGLITIMTVGWCCTSPAFAQWDPYTQEELDWLARAVVGEVSVMGEELRQPAGAWIVHSALNRTVNKWFPGDLVKVIQQGYNGAWVWEHDKPPEWAYDVVQSTIELRAHAGVDPSRGALFVFGGQDIVPCMEPAMVVIRRPGWVFSVHVYDAWPYPEGCWYE